MNNTSHSAAYTRTVNELAAAQKYLYKNHTPVIGRSHSMQCVIERLKMPALPRLMSNIEQRRALQKRSIVSCLLTGARIRIEKAYQVFEDAVNQEKRKEFFVPLYYLESAEPHEQLETEPLTFEQFNKLCNE